MIYPEELRMAGYERDRVNKHINLKWAAAEDEAAKELEGKQVDKPSTLNLPQSLTVKFTLNHTETNANMSY